MNLDPPTKRYSLSEVESLTFGNISFKPLKPSDLGEEISPGIYRIGALPETEPEEIE